MQGWRTQLIVTLAALLASCARAPAPPSASPLPVLPSPHPSPTALPPSPTPFLAPSHAAPTWTPSQDPTQAPLITPMPPAAAHLQLDCFDILPERPAGLAAAGTLLFASVTNEAMYVDAGTGAETPMTLPHESRFNFVVSPDRQRVVYRRVLRDGMRIQIIDDSLVIADAADRPISVRPWENGWTSVAGWLDGSRLIINIAAKDGDQALAKKPATLIVLDLNTGRPKVLAPDFPNMNFEYPVPNWDNWGVTMYDSTLTRVVYPFDSFERFDAGYTLWDVPNQRALAHLPSTLRTHTPRWSPDGARFVVAASQGGGESWLSFELYSVERNGGEPVRLTFLTEYYAAVYIQSYTWSPDGRRIAFWMVEEPQGVPFIEHGEAHLAVLDTETGEVTNTCVPGEYDATVGPARVPPPLWSPDGAQLLVENSAPDGNNRVLLVDLASQAAAAIARQVKPEGWMVK
jgi:hypothetical protein